MREKKGYAGKAGRWDARRNTSMVHAVPHGAGEEVVAMLRRYKDEEWYRWVAYGRPTYTEDEYRRVRKTGAPVTSTPVAA
jgi:hypothetical protein